MLRVIRGLIIVCVGFAVFISGCQGQKELGTGTVVGNEKKVSLMEETNLFVLTKMNKRFIRYAGKTARKAA